MTRERLNYLIDMADECSRKTDSIVTVGHNRIEDTVFVSMPNGEYHNFVTNVYHENRYNSTKDDNVMTRAEAFMRMLMRQAELGHLTPAPLRTHGGTVPP